MIAKWLRTAASWMGRRRKLIVVGFELPDQSSHYFNELLAYKSAAEALGLTPKIFVPQLADPRLVAALGATPILDPLFQPADMAPERLGSELATCLSASETLGYLWDAIETEDLSQIRAIVFPQPNPAAIRAASLWLGRKRSGPAPDIFFRFVWGFDRPGPLSESHVLACHLAAKDLNTRPGHEHVFFLANSRGALSSIMRVCDRRAFMVPVPRLLTATATTSSMQLVRSTIYVHLNCRSAQLMDGLAEIVRRVKIADPRAQFLIKFTLSAGTEAKSRLLDADIVESIEILPAEQSLEDYLANFLRCSIALLAYEPGPYATATSGVFVEAAALGRPVVVPADTWMAQELAAGRGVGTVFAEPTPSSVAAAVTEALQSYRQLSVAAQELAPSLREAQSCQRLLERMLALTGQDLDMAPRYHLGEEIDFRDCYDSRCFMGKGWSVNESWGVWTEGSLAQLSLRLDDAEPGQPLILRARVHPFLAGTHQRLSVRVSACGQEIAEWIFELGAAKEKWRVAEIPPRADLDRPLDIAFAIDAPRSPYELGLSKDTRLLGLGLITLSISAKSKSKNTRSKLKKKTGASPVSLLPASAGDESQSLREREDAGSD